MAMTLRLTEAETESLRATAAREGRSMHETVVIAISEYVSKRERKRDDLIAAIVAEDAEVLDRLGTV
jgi:hypothetical protein